MSSRSSGTLALVLALGALPAVAFDYPFHAGAATRRVVDLPAPAGFERSPVAAGSFADYVRRAPLMPPGSPVLRHDGAEVHGATEITAVLDMPLLNQNQQCADSALRYWFEYLREAGRTGEIACRLTSGDGARLADWRRRPGEGDDAHYRRFLAHCMEYVGSYSMNRDLRKIDAAELAPGDLIVQPNPKAGIGHLSLVVDVARDARGRTALLVAYGFLPAQSVHLPKPGPGNGADASSPWFTLEGFQRQHEPLGAAYTYRRFEQQDVAVPTGR